MREWVVWFDDGFEEMVGGDGEFWRWGPGIGMLIPSG